METYYNVGKLLFDAGKSYGEGIIKEYSKRLTNEFGKGYNTSNLKRMRKFYLSIEKGATLSHQLTWSHYVEVITLNDINIMNYYINMSVNCMISVRELRLKIKSLEYERLPDSTKNKLIKKEETSLQDFVKEPIIITVNSEYEKFNEKVLQKIILENITSFLKELGSGFSYIDHEYRIKLGNRYNYIDLLLFYYKYNAFVVVELKVEELRKEHIGQIEVYMNYVDNNIKSINHNKTIGIIMVKKNNELIMEYSSDPRIISREYNLV